MKIEDLIADTSNALYYLEEYRDTDKREFLIEAGERLKEVVESITKELGWAQPKQS